MNPDLPDDTLAKIWIEAELQGSVARLTVQSLIAEVRQQRKRIVELEAIRADWLKGLKMLDAAGVWTGADDLIHDRIWAVLGLGMNFVKLENPPST